MSEPNNTTPLARVLYQRGLKMSWLARELEYSVTTVSGWHSGRTIPNRDQAVILARMFPELTVEEVLFPNGVPPDVRMSR